MKKTALFALVALSFGLSAALPASAAFGPKDLVMFDGPGFGPEGPHHVRRPGLRSG